MLFNQQEGTIKITGYTVLVYRNEDDDIVLKQQDPYEDDSIIIIGKEQLKGLIEALRKLPSIQV